MQGILHDNLTTFKNIEGNPETVHVFQWLGQTYLLKGQLEDSEMYLQKALSFGNQHEHPERFTAFEDLAALYLQKAAVAEKAGSVEQSLKLKSTALAYLKQALEIAVIYLPENSPHIQRIKDKLKNFDPILSSQYHFRSIRRCYQIA